MAEQVTFAAFAGWMAPRPRVPVASRPRKVFLAREVGMEDLIGGWLQFFEIYIKLSNKLRKS